MFKAHPITSLLNLILLITALSFLNNSIVLFFISLAILFSNRHTEQKEYACFLKLVLIITMLNLCWGHLNLLIKIFFLAIYVIEGCRGYSKMDVFYVLDTLFPHSNNKALFFMKVIYYKDVIKKNYEILKNIDKELGYKKNYKYYFFVIQKCLIASKEEVNRYLKSYERSLYLNNSRNKYKIPFSKEDVFLLIAHIIVVVLVYYGGGQYYAIFN